jgi:ribosomal protein S18 acetylase RimI-like enzyme
MNEHTGQAGIIKRDGSHDQQRPLALRRPDPDISIRAVRISDATALHDSCWPDRPLVAIYQLVNRAYRHAKQKRGLGAIITARDDTTAFGYGQLTLWPRGAEISDLIVAESHRSRGLGTALIQYLVQAAHLMSVPQVMIGAALSNPGAVTLYRRLGFRDSSTVMLNLGQGQEAVLYLTLDLPVAGNDE